MRILIIDKTAGLESSHERHQAIARVSGVNLHVLGPSVWIENGRRIVWRPRIDARYTCHLGAVWGKGHYARVFYRSGMARAMREAQPDVIQLLEEPWSITAAQCLAYAAVIAPNARICFYTWENIERGWNYPARAAALYAAIEKIMQGRAAGAVCATNGAREVMLKKGFSQPMAVIPYGIPSFFFAANELEKNEEKPFTIGYIGRLLTMKGVDILLNAAAKLDGIQLIMIGDGEDRYEFQRLASALGIENRIRWVESQAERAIPRWLARMDALVLPSRTTPGWREQLGRVVIEAMAARVAAIGSSSGAIPEVIGDAGLVFEEGDAASLCAAIQRLRENSSERETFRRRGRERAEQMFRWDAFAESLIDFYRNQMNFESSSHD
ncbi:MAG: glycosyltransferase [bacterium]|nr:glycosyltransferase [bacterium]